MNNSFYDNMSIKALCIKNIQLQADAGNLVQGIEWENASGGFIGCSINKYDFELWSKETGLPKWLGYYCEQIFQGLKYADALHFAINIYQAIPVGVDLTPVIHMTAMDRMDRLLSIVSGLDIDQDLKNKVNSSIESVKKLNQKVLNGHNVSDDEWLAAREDAWTASWTAAWTRSWAAERAAGWASEQSPEREVSWSAERSASCFTLNTDGWIAERDSLFKALKEYSVCV